MQKSDEPGEDDVKWYEIQQRVYTRWVNNQLAKRGLKLDELQSGLQDGLMLIALLEEISGKHLPRHNKKPRIKVHKVENLSVALGFVQREGIKLVNVSGEDIFEGNRRIILGLIWTLICQYMIVLKQRTKKQTELDAGSSHATQQTEEEEGHVQEGAVGSASNQLLEWIRARIPEYHIDNFQKDWNDGRALCALVNSLAPKTIPDHKDKDSAQGLANCTLGIETAHTRLGITPLILPEELHHPKVDRNAVMTYLAQFMALSPEQLELKQVTEIIPPKPKEASLFRAAGDGLVHGVAGVESLFEITCPTVYEGKLEVKVEGPEDNAEMFIDKDEVTGNLDVSYTPTNPGLYKVSVTVDGHHIPGSVFEVQVITREDIELPGPKGKVQVFFSTTTSSASVRSAIERLEWLFYQLRVHLRPDFEPWVAVDMISKEEREAVFARAGTREVPIVFIDGKFIGGYAEIEELNDTGELEDLLGMNDVTLLTEEEHLQRLGLLGKDGEFLKNGITHYCGDCGNPRLKQNKYCPDCGGENPKPILKGGNRVKWFTSTRRYQAKAGEVGGDVSGTLQQFAFKSEDELVDTLRERKIPNLKLEDITTAQYMEAAYLGDLDLVKGIIYAGYDVNAKDAEGNTAVQAALDNGNWEVVAFLMRNGAEKPKFGEMALMSAAAAGDANKVKALAIAGADVDNFDQDLITPIQAAREYGHADVARWLLQRGANMKTPQERVFQAVQQNDVQGLSAFLDKYGARAPLSLPRVGDKKTPLDVAQAAGQSHQDMVALLTKHGAQTSLELQKNDIAMQFLSLVDKVEGKEDTWRPRLRGKALRESKMLRRKGAVEDNTALIASNQLDSDDEGPPPAGVEVGYITEGSDEDGPPGQGPPGGGGGDDSD